MCRRFVLWTVLLNAAVWNAHIEFDSRSTTWLTTSPTAETYIASFDLNVNQPLKRTMLQWEYTSVRTLTNRDGRARYESHQRLTNIDELLQEYNVRIMKIASEWNAYNYPEFAFAVQTFTQHLVIPDFSYLSTLDCFHPSLLAHQQVAIAGWNCALLPAGQKPTSFTPNQTITCPTPDDRIWVG